MQMGLGCVPSCPAKVSEFYSHKMTSSVFVNFLGAVARYLTRSSSSKDGLSWLACWQQQEPDGHIAVTIRKQRAMSVCPASALLCIMSRALTNRKVLHEFQMGLSISLAASRNCLMLTHEGLVSTVSLKSQQMDHGD